MSESARTYYERFLHNASFAERIEVSLPEDQNWSCVVRFYAVLHLMSAYLVLKSNVSFDPTSASHHQRKADMSKCPELRTAPQRYRDLKDLSESVRYDPGFIYKNEHHADAKKHMATIISIVEPKVKKLLGIS